MATQLASGHMMAIQSTKKAVNLYVKWMFNQVFDASCALEYLCAERMLAKVRGESY
jgi:hypothetical protein